jgi:hypothetical protein
MLVFHLKASSWLELESIDDIYVSNQYHNEDMNVKLMEIYNCPIVLDDDLDEKNK